MSFILCVPFLKLQEASVKDGLNLHSYSWLVKKSVTNRMFYLESYLRPGNTNLDLCSVTTTGEISVIPTSWWYFSLDHFHYARWLSVHIFDVHIFDFMVLEIVHNNVFENFYLGHFCFKKTNGVFSMTALDQLQEQNSWTIKKLVASNFANRADDSALFGGRHAVRKFHELLMSLKTHLQTPSWK